MQTIDTAATHDRTFRLAAENAATWRVTESALKDAIRQRDTRLVEMQHRIANSLQIVASILQTKARAVECEQTRGHLQDACQRVMAVASVQEQLKSSRHGDAVAVGPYLRRLCETLAGSMIGGDRTIAVTVSSAEGDRPTSDVMDVGLIVTELLINAVKYAFPDPASWGEIAVDYRTGPAGWSLEVRDNGVGLAASADGGGTSGLGMRIVAALARGLSARVETVSTPSGTRVTIRSQAFAPLVSTAASTAAQTPTPLAEEQKMTKGNKQRGNREAKKPKQEKPKAVATAAFQNASKAPVLGSKKAK